MAKPKKPAKACRRVPGRKQAVPAQAAVPPTPLPSARVLCYSLQNADATFDYTEKEEDTPSLSDSSKSSGSHLLEKLRDYKRSLVVSTLHKLPPEVRVMIYTLCMDMEIALDERKLVRRQITPPMCTFGLLLEIERTDHPNSSDLTTSGSSLVPGGVSRVLRCQHALASLRYLPPSYQKSLKDRGGHD